LRQGKAGKIGRQLLGPNFQQKGRQRSPIDGSCPLYEALGLQPPGHPVRYGRPCTVQRLNS
jgi:hypothetical protein